MFLHAGNNTNNQDDGGTIIKRKQRVKEGRKWQVKDTKNKLMKNPKVISKKAGLKDVVSYTI